MSANLMTMVAAHCDVNCRNRAEQHATLVSSELFHFLLSSL